MRSEATTVDDYLAELPPDRRAALSRLRQILGEAAPEALESMKYGHPHWTLAGPLFALAAQKHFLALYVAEHDLVASARPRLGGLDLGKSCIRFRRLDDLPLDVIADIARAAAERRRVCEGATP